MIIAYRLANYYQLDDKRHIRSRHRDARNPYLDKDSSSRFGFYSGTVPHRSSLYHIRFTFIPSTPSSTAYPFDFKRSRSSSDFFQSLALRAWMRSSIIF